MCQLYRHTFVPYVSNVVRLKLKTLNHIFCYVAFDGDAVVVSALRSTDVSHVPVKQIAAFRRQRGQSTCVSLRHVSLCVCVVCHRQVVNVFLQMTNSISTTQLSRGCRYHCVLLLASQPRPPSLHSVQRRRRRRRGWSSVYPSFL